MRLAFDGTHFKSQLFKAQHIVMLLLLLLLFRTFFFKFYLHSSVHLEGTKEIRILDITALNEVLNCYADTIQ